MGEGPAGIRDSHGSASACRRVPDRTGFAALAISKERPVGAGPQWEQGHVFIQRRWFRPGGPTQWFPE